MNTSFIRRTSTCIKPLTPFLLRKNSTKPKFSKILCSVKQIVPKANENDDQHVETLRSKSLKLMLYRGLIHHASAGNYHLLPLAMRSLEKLTNIIDKFMNSINAQKIDMPILIPGDLWKKSGRWDLMGSEMYRLLDRHENDYCLAPTCEETITTLLADAHVSYNQLPLLLYQISKKFRDEKKVKFGLLRGKEFLMKDLYSFDETLEMAEQTYNRVCNIYSKLFDFLGVKYVKALASTSVMGGSLSHEFHLFSDVGEDKIFVCTKCGYAANIEIGHKTCPTCNKECEVHQTIEVGHTFLLGTTYSKKFKANFVGAEKKLEVLQMGCFGLGVTRILAAVVEQLSLDNAIRWPLQIAPYTICIISPKKGSKEEKANATSLAHHIHEQQENIPCLQGDILLDDRDQFTIGNRLRDAKILGFPFIIVVGQKAAESIPKVELINVKEDSVQYLTIVELFQWFYKSFTLQNHKNISTYL